ncbi:MAG: phospholipid carrier-dependent glycosyltransferase, partial [Candidatus Saccharibacteria bacterium]
MSSKISKIKAAIKKTYTKTFKLINPLILPIKLAIKQHPHRSTIILLLGLGFVTRFWLFGYPNQAVFDEVYFGKFVTGYYTHQYFFDIHPPLGKLLIAGFAWLFHYNPTQSFAAIGTEYTDSGYLVLRFLPSLASACLPVIVYLIARELRLKQSTAALIGLAVVFENALITQGHFILIDSFLILFGFLSLWAWLVWRRTSAWKWYVLASLFAAMSMSVKWTGMIFAALIILIELGNKRPEIEKIKRVSIIIATIAVVYITSFAIHLSLLTKSGDGDVFMTPAFQAT